MTAVTDVGVGVVELLRALIEPGQAVVFNTPVYAPFFDWVPEAGGTALEVPLAHDTDGWRLDLAVLEAAFATRPAVYLLCNPHNPVGRAHTADELAAVVEMARRHRVTVVSDEIHAPLVLDGPPFTPILTVPGAAEMSASVLSASKAWNLAGLKCAVIVTGSSDMAAVIGRFSPDVRWRTGHFGVLASIAAFTEGEPWLDQFLATLRRRRSQLASLLAEHLPLVSWHPPSATYLAWLDCRSIGRGSQPCDRFLERGRVALAPGPRFGPDGDGFVRLNFATSAEILEEAVTRMARSL